MYAGAIVYIGPNPAGTLKTAADSVLRETLIKRVAGAKSANLCGAEYYPGRCKNAPFTGLRALELAQVIVTSAQEHRLITIHGPVSIRSQGRGPSK